MGNVGRSHCFGYSRHHTGGYSPGFHLFRREVELYRLCIPLVFLLSAVCWVILGFLSRRAHKESWFCIYSVFEQSFIEDGRPLFRTQEEQDQAKLGEALSFGGGIFMGIFMAACAVWCYFQ